MVAMKALRGVATLFKYGEYNTIPGIAGDGGCEYGSSDVDVDTAGDVNQQTLEGAVVTEAVVVQITKGNPFRPLYTASQSMTSSFSVENTQDCAEPPDVGSGCDELSSDDDKMDTEGEAFGVENAPPAENDDECSQAVTRDAPAVQAVHVH
ncbi:hypothetical protein PF005_g1985 [Phytophthora fragariae]|uniref:Uncharacterized protein n=2 Tax=Phytophthora fragariae TaxID=53985 RepID=A0A6A3TJW5_9STRA|nr:hypothetical protein PF003_g22362 [Phytophthora fragariae]KAE9138145.1 hypothetical protein PF007_g1518 [Phytophthora fragariae]KAE9234232.1 hypothetical protein PF005_g1985 [Phytophthora fragariae]